MATYAILLLFFFFSILLPNGLASSFTIDLIHYDSPESPFFNSSETLYDRVLRDIRQTDSRIIEYLLSSGATPEDISSSVHPSGGGYLMSISLGTPPVQFWAILDTGSHLTWNTPCDSTIGSYDPSRSSTYGPVPFDSEMCQLVKPCKVRPSISTGGTCIYSCTYADEADTEGTLSTDTLTMSTSNRGTVAFPNVIFGCSFNKNGNYGRSSGIAGLGAGPLSLLNQLPPSVPKRFAYCLVPRTLVGKSSKMDFGDDAIVSGEGTVNIPLISNPDSKAFYSVTLKAIAVGNKIVWSNTETANALIDSGSTVTTVAASAYDHLESEVKSAINLTPIKFDAKGLGLCYEFPRDFKVPEIKFVFDGGEVVLGAMNTFRPVPDKNKKKTDVSCLAFRSTESLKRQPKQVDAIIGNIAQQNFRVGYDLAKMKLAMKPTDCARQ